MNAKIAEKLTGSYRGIVTIVAIIIVVGTLVTQGYMDNEYADKVFWFMFGGGTVGAAALKVNPPGK